MTTAKARWIRNIHTAKNKLALDNDSYRLILESAAEVDSASKITTWQQYDSCMAAFKKLGFVLTAGKNTLTDNSPRNPDWVTARQEYYINGLWLLAARSKDEKSLCAMIKRIGGVDSIHFLPKKKAQAVIIALRDIAQKAGFNPDTKKGKESCCY